ncbi:MAG: guanylate kinase, partial [Gammaproteobacteria bacterium]|nr:guanylate kinase [Gammaproteobacteria bacterium]
MSNNDQGTLFIVSAPSGAGKSSLLHAALMESQGIQLSVSHTTRTPRNGEEDGLHYNFVTTEAFGAEIEADQFLEYAKVFDNFYGTSELWVRESLRHGNDVILEIDWQGAEQVRKKIPEAVTLF